MRLHLLKERLMKKFPKLGESLGILCPRKLFNDIAIRSKMKANPDYSVDFTLEKRSVSTQVSTTHIIRYKLQTIVI